MRLEDLTEDEISEGGLFLVYLEHAVEYEILKRERALAPIRAMI